MPLKTSKYDVIHFEEKTEINGVFVIPQSENQIKLQTELTGDDDQQVLEIAKKKMESIVLALTIVSGAPLILGDVHIESKESASGKQKTITIFETITITDSVKVDMKLGAKRLKEVSMLATKLDSLTPDGREALLRIHKWFSRAKLDMDLIDRFIQLYIALEVIGECKYPNQTYTNRVRQTLTDYLDNSKLAENIVKTRCALLHSGKKETEVNQYIPYMEKTIVEIIWINIKCLNLFIIHLYTRDKREGENEYSNRRVGFKES